MTKKKLVAIIGGSGIKDSPAFENAKWKQFDTKFIELYNYGRPDPADKNDKLLKRGVVEYQIDEERGVIFIPRHGHTKKYGPSRTQYGANVLLAKHLGATVIVSISATGSLKESIKVGSLVIPDDYIDNSGRDDNYFGEDFVVHAQSADYPLSPNLRKILKDEAEKYETKFEGIYTSGTYVVIPGDRFGTKAEGKMRTNYGDIVGMTIMPEVSYAMQLGMESAVVAIPVDMNIDANHAITLQIMEEKGEHDKLPAFVDSVVDKLVEYAQDVKRIPQLDLNIIHTSLDYIGNSYLKNAAEELMRTQSHFDLSLLPKNPMVIRE